MPRAIWTGSISFGLVNVPVKMYPAVREQRVAFHLLHDEDNVRLQRKLVCPVDGKEVHPEHQVRGFEIGPDQHVIVRQEELDALAPKATRTIELVDFVDLAEIDPLYYDRPYYLVPQQQATKAYALLVQAMEQSKRVGIARFVMRNKEHLAALRPLQGVICLETMNFADEVTLPHQLEDAPAKTKLDDRELKAAQQLIDSLSTSFKPEQYHDEYRQRVQELVEKKASGEEVVTAPAVEEKPARVINLMAALQASLAEAKKKRSKTPEPRRKKSA